MHFLRLFAPLVALTLVGCQGDSNFSGSGKTQQEPEEAPATPDRDFKERPDKVKRDTAKRPAADPTRPELDTGKLKEEVFGSSDDSEDKTLAEVLDTFDIPDNPTVETKGSFTIWADPPSPALRQEYYIHIAVKFGKTVSNYGLTDLTGTIAGTDGFTYNLSANPTFTIEQIGIFNEPTPDKPTIQTFGDHAIIKVRIPGSTIPATKDSITIRSAMLSESQSIDLQFQ